MFILAISFQRCCVLVGHGRHKTSYHVLGQVGAIAEIIIINIFVCHLHYSFNLLLTFIVVSFYLDDDRDGIYETDRKLCTKNYVKDGDFK